MMNYFFAKQRSTAQHPRGYILLIVLVFGSVGIYVIGGLVGWAISDIRASRQTFEREQGIQIAEAGIDYYRWHLAHSPTDYQDGTGVAGPYIHDFLDKDGNVVGHFSLTITPPPLGSTLVTVVSTGSTTNPGAVERSIRVQFAKPSIAKYAVVANDRMRFGGGTEVFGPIHSNQGIRFDGLTHNVITSSVASYDDQDHAEVGADTLEFGVHTHTNPPPAVPAPPNAPLNNNARPNEAPPSLVPARTDIFEAGRQFPVPVVDFGGITADLAVIKSEAQASGFYRANSGSLGYRVRFKTDGNFDLYRVTSYAGTGGCANSGQAGWGTWSVNASNLLGTYDIPNNGLMFFEDHVFVDGQIDGERVTLVAATLPDVVATRRNIIVNNDLLYTNYDGTDVIGLIAQQNFLVGLVSDTNLRIDAAVISQNGFSGRYSYTTGSCGAHHTKTSLTLQGMIGTNIRYGFAYTSGGVFANGYQTRNLNYDSLLLYGPPPNFPLASDEYVTLSWEEL
jgi:hypothetical protein